MGRRLAKDPARDPPRMPIVGATKEDGNDFVFNFSQCQ